MRHFLRLMTFALFGSVAGPGIAAVQTADCSMASAFDAGFERTLQSCSARLDATLPDAERVQTLKVRAHVWKWLGRLDDAIADVEAALKLAPRDAELHVMRGWYHHEMGQGGLALERVRRALAFDPDHGAAYNLAGHILFGRGDYRGAEQNYGRAVMLSPNNMRVRFNRYLLFNRLGRLREALAELDAILALPDAVTTRDASFDFHGRLVTWRAGARLLRALVLIALDRRPEADALYDQLVAEDPSTVTYTARAVHHRQYESRPEADVLADLTKAMELDPDYWAPHNSLARMLFHKQQYAAAADSFGHAIARAPTRGEPRWWRAMTLRKLDRIEEATADALSVLDVDPQWIVSRKLATLREQGYFVPASAQDDMRTALRDAVQACMLDERCW